MWLYLHHAEFNGRALRLARRVLERDCGCRLLPGGCARPSSVCGHRWMPLIPVADNGSFVLDLGF
jgi:hypothetical protein